MSLCAPEAALRRPSSGCPLGGGWSRELDIGARGSGCLANTPGAQLGARQDCTADRAPAATLPQGVTSAPPGLAAWSARAAPSEPRPALRTPAPPACGAARWYDDPAGPAVPAGGSGHERGGGSLSRGEAHEPARDGRWPPWPPLKLSPLT